MIKITKRDPENYSGKLLICFIEQTKEKQPSLGLTGLNKMLKQAWTMGDFSGKADEKLFFYPPATTGKAQALSVDRVLVIGLGEQEKEQRANRERLRVAGGIAAGEACRLKAEEALAILPEHMSLPPFEIAECITEGLVLGNYQFRKYKNKKDDEDQPGQVKTFVLYGGSLPSVSVRRGMTAGRIGSQAACIARDMANEPGNKWRPAEFAGFGKKISKEYGLKYRVLEKSDLKRLGMGGILGVNQGSAVPPKLVILEYKTSKKNPTLMLVGKGLTFDSGGISIKPSAGMEDMKYDMCGGAAVISVMQAIGEEQPENINIVALIPATENLPGAHALKPGDIVTHYGGKTSEVVNTDAEGRLILADSLAYGIEKYKPDAVIDLATLTGAVIIGLGHHRTGLLGNNDQLVDRILGAGEKCGEPLWRLPLDPEYTKQLKSEVADLKNIGGRPGGTITAASYLAEFVGETPWAHLDIAGTAWNFTEKSYIPKKGPSGTGVRTLLELVRNWKAL